MMGPAAATRAWWALTATVAGAYAWTLLAVGGAWDALAGVGVQALVMAPGVLIVRRVAPGAGWLPLIAIGPAVGLGLSNLALLGLWAAGGRGLWVIPAAAAIAAAVALPAGRLSGRWRLASAVPGDAYAVLLAVLIVPLIVARPFSLVGLETPEGHVYRAYFTADYVWRRAVVAELAKGAFLPQNPFYVGDVLHYYWMPHLLSAVEYRAGGASVSLDTLLLTRSVLVDAAFVAGLYGMARLIVPRPWAALAGVACTFLFSSYEGTAALWEHWRLNAPLSLVRVFNIDAVTRWLYQGMPIDGLHRVLLYQPHHALGYLLGLLGVLAVARRTRERDPAVFFAAGALLALSTLISSFAGVMFTAVAAGYEVVDTLRRRGWTAAFFNAPYAALPLVVGAAIVTALEYVDRPGNTNLGVIRLGLNELAARRFWLVTFLSFGPMLLLGLAGAAVAVRRGLRDAWPLAAMVVVGAWFYFYVDIRDHQDVYVGWRVGHLTFMALVPLVGLAFMAWRGLRGRARWLAAAAVAAVLVPAAPMVAIDLYNTQDLALRDMGPGFRWVQILSHDEWEGLEWLRTRTPPDAVVQVDAYARDSDTWAYIPAFAERRMGVGLPISMVPLFKYQEGSRVVQWMYDVDDASTTYAMAARVGIDYLVVGEPERRAHPGVEARFAREPGLLPQVFHNRALSIYEVRHARH
jgi:hypothetical protein